MEIIDLIATKETIDVTKGGVIIYDTDITTKGPGIILLDNPDGSYSLTLISSYHPSGPVKVIMKGVSQAGNKKYRVGDVVAKLAVLPNVEK
jgi:hypothetical protein